ncbi:MAG: oligosaccharide flippase family protein [Agarilytica sp.]
MLYKLRSKSDALLQKYGSSQAIVATFWVVAGTGGTQVIRLLSNLLLTRLLFPEVFGLMALVYAVLVFLGQVSDIGLREGVVNSKRINDSAFMQTAWTLQILRSTLIALVAVAVAYPFANFYGQDILAPVLAMVGVSMFITGFKSIGLLAYDKRLDLKTQTIVDVIQLAAGLIVMLVWAWISPSVWALVGGQIVSSLLDVYLSYRLFHGHHSKLKLERKALIELFSFGKWIVISSTISFIIVQGDRLIMGKWLPIDQLGLYSIASTWSAIVALISFNLSTRVLHPYFRQKLDAGSDFTQIHKTRTQLNAAYAFVCIALAFIGDWLIQFMYDDRYLGAGWMLQILAVGQIGRVFTGTLRPFLIACGDSFSQMVTSTASAFILVLFFALGHWFGGPHGMIIGYALSGFVMHPIMVLFAHKHGYKCMAADMGVAFLACALIAFIWLLVDAPIVNVVVQMWEQFTFTK